MIYTVTCNPALDYIMRLPGPVTEGSTNRAGETLIQPGGKGINVSAVLRALDTPSTALGFVAGESGDWLVRLLAGSGLQTDFARLPAGQTRINVKLKAGPETEINAPGPDIPPQALEALYHRLDRLQAGDSLILAGSVPKSLPADFYAGLLRRLDGRGVQTVVDAEGQLLADVLPWHPFLVKPNRAELEGLLGCALTNDALVAEGAAALQVRGARQVLVSLGGDGALLRTAEGRTLRMAAPTGVVRNSVGAGDSMVAGFLAGWTASGGDPAAALRLAVAAGSATAFADGLADGPSIRQMAQGLPQPREICKNAAGVPACSCTADRKTQESL